LKDLGRYILPPFLFFSNRKFAIENICAGGDQFIGNGVGMLVDSLACEGKSLK